MAAELCRANEKDRLAIRFRLRINSNQIDWVTGNGVCLLLQQGINSLNAEANDSYLTLKHVEVERVESTDLFLRLCEKHRGYLHFGAVV
jgi:hypothetical protein